MITFFAMFVAYDAKIDAVHFNVVKEGQDFSWSERLSFTRYSLMGLYNYSKGYEEQELLDQIGGAIAKHLCLNPRDVEVVLKDMPK